MLSLIKNIFFKPIACTRALHRLKFEPLTENHYEKTLDHLRTTSYFDVPLYKVAGLVGPGKSPKELDTVFLESMKEKVSMIALKDDKLAGVIINGVLTPAALPAAIEYVRKAKNEDYKKMDYMFLKLLQDLDLFDRFGIEKALECRLLSTTREYRGTGLGKVLVDKLTQTARDFNLPLIVGEAVNNYLWKLLVAEGWIMVREMPYSDYIDEATGKPMFKVDPPHHILGVCVRIVDQKCKSKDPLPLPSLKIYYPIKMD